MVTIVLFLSLIFAPINAFASPLAIVSTGMDAFKKKVETMHLYQIMVNTYQNYQTVKTTYELARAGYQTFRDPEEWKAAQRYAENRIKALSQPSPNPTQTALYRSVMQLGDTVGAYTKQTTVYMKAEGVFKNSYDRFSDFDRAAGQRLNVATGGEFFDQLEHQTVDRRLGWEDARKQLLAAKEGSDALDSEFARLAQAAEDAAVEMRQLDTLEGFNQLAVLNAERKLRNAKDSKDQAAAKNALESARANLTQTQARKVTLTKCMEDLKKESDELMARVLQEKSGLESAIAASGLKGIAMRLMAYSGLSIMGEKEMAVLDLSRAVWIFMICATALALIWLAFRTSTSHSNVSLGFVWGMIGAFAFLTPKSPIHIHRIANIIAVCTDTLEMSIFKDSIIEANAEIYKQYGDTMAALTGFKESEAGKSSTFSKITDYALLGSPLGVYKDVVKLGAVNAASVGAVSLTAAVFQIIGQAGAVLGIVAVVISMNLRTLFFWVLFMMGPLIVALAPLKWARSSLIPNWASSIFATVLWGYIAKILFVLFATITVQNNNFVGAVENGTKSLQLVMGLVQGSLLSVLMIFTPFLAFSLAKGSIDGFGISTAQGVAMSGGVGLGSAAKWGATRGLTMGNQIADGIGRRLTQMAGRGTGIGANLARNMAVQTQNIGRFLRSSRDAVNGKI